MCMKAIEKDLQRLLEGQTLKQMSEAFSCIVFWAISLYFTLFWMKKKHQRLQK